MPVRVEDETGHINIYMREKAALDLSRTDSKEEFEAARADDSMDFPKNFDHDRSQTFGSADTRCQRQR